MSQLYCGDCQNYLMGSDGQCHDCGCGWKQPVETYEKENTELEAEVARLQKENAEQAKIIAELKNDEDMANAIIGKNARAYLDAFEKNATLKETNAAQAKRIEDLIAKSELKAHKMRIEIEALRKQVEEMLTAMRRAVLALAFTAESSNAMKDDYQALSNAIEKAVSAQKGTES